MEHQDPSEGLSLFLRYAQSTVAPPSLLSYLLVCFFSVSIECFFIGYLLCDLTRATEKVFRPGGEGCDDMCQTIQNDGRDLVIEAEFQRVDRKGETFCVIFYTREWVSN